METALRRGAGDRGPAARLGPIGGLELEVAVGQPTFKVGAD